MRHGDSVVMLIRRGDEATPTGGAAALYAYVADVDRVSVVTDPDGYRWVLATFKKLAPFKVSE